MPAIGPSPVSARSTRSAPSEVETSQVAREAPLPMRATLLHARAGGGLDEAPEPLFQGGGYWAGAASAAGSAT